MTSVPSTEIAGLIASTPGVYGGRPCLAGTRFPVLEVAAQYNGGSTAEEIAASYELDLAAVYAGVAYYLLNKDEIDGELARERSEYSAALASHRNRAS